MNSFKFITGPQVEFTTANRTSQSAYHFLRGVFGDDQVAKIKMPRPRPTNWKLRVRCRHFLNSRVYMIYFQLKYCICIFSL